MLFRHIHLLFILSSFKAYKHLNHCFRLKRYRTINLSTPVSRPFHSGGQVFSHQWLDLTTGVKRYTLPYTLPQELRHCYKLPQKDIKKGGT